MLNELKYKGFARWGTFTLICYMMYRSHYVSPGRMVKTWLPFSVIVILATIILLMVKLMI